MERIEAAAFECTARGAGFGALAITMTMLGFSFDLALAVKIGAVGFSLMAAILLFRGETAHRRDHRRSEIWLMLPKPARPQEAVAQGVIARASSKASFRFGHHAASLSLALWGVEMMLVAASVIA